VRTFSGCRLTLLNTCGLVHSSSVTSRDIDSFAVRVGRDFLRGESFHGLPNDVSGLISVRSKSRVLSVFSPGANWPTLVPDAAVSLRLK